MDILLIFFATQIFSALATRCPEGQMEHTFCCVPVWSCREGYYIKTCEREGAEDKCLKCPPGTDNPFNSSSFDLKKCYKKICKLSDSVSVSDNTCECDRSKGWFGENSLACQLKYGGCPAGKELTQKGRCERCTNFHYKDWHGYGFCARHFDCSRLQMAEIKGNATHANKCVKKHTVAHKTTTTTTSTKLTLSSSPMSSSSTIASASTTKVSTTTSSIKILGGRNSDLKHHAVSPTEISQRLPVVGNRAPSAKEEVVRSGRIEGILIVVVAILCFLLLCVVCIGTVAYLRRRLKSSRNVTIPQRPALPLPSTQTDQHVGSTFAPPVYQSQRQTQPLLQHENPYLCMSNPHQSCIYALPASLHLNNHNTNYPPSRSSSVFDTVSTYGLNYNSSQSRPISTVSPNSHGPQQRHEHLYMTLPAERSETPTAAAPTTLAAMTTLTTMAAATTTAHLDPMSLENRNSTATENFYEFP